MSKKPISFTIVDDPDPCGGFPVGAIFLTEEMILMLEFGSLTEGTWLKIRPSCSRLHLCAGLHIYHNHKLFKITEEKVWCEVCERPTNEYFDEDNNPQCANPHHQERLRAKLRAEREGLKLHWIQQAGKKKNKKKKRGP